ncbi:MAG: DsbE family thiol:disulfide interchange protein [Gammaproteobacteria bacterium]|nr:DsbE family thiol:disulfide interchange protein [Gammaproteobacteria bacterium]
MSQSTQPIAKMAIPALIVVALLFGLFFFSLQEDKPLVPSMRENKPLPPFSSKQLFGQEVISSEELKGDYYLLNFWGSWCPTCYVEHPYLMTLKDQGVRIIGVNYRDTEDKAKSFLERMGDPYEYSFFDPKGKIAIEMGITAAPETFLISPDGKVLFHRIGEMNSQVFEAAFLPLMKSQ